MSGKYFDNEEVYQHLYEFRSQLSCASLSADAQPDDFIGIKMMQVADGILQTSNFRNYPPDVKEDIKSFACFKMTRGLQLYDMSRGPGFLFNYLTRICYFAALTTVSQYYKHKNLVRDLTRKALVQIGAPQEMIAKFKEYQPREDKKKSKFNRRKTTEKVKDSLKVKEEK